MNINKEFVELRGPSVIYDFTLLFYYRWFSNILTACGYTPKCMRFFLTLPLIFFLVKTQPGKKGAGKIRDHLVGLTRLQWPARVSRSSSPICPTVDLHFKSREAAFGVEESISCLATTACLSGLLTVPGGYLYLQNLTPRAWRALIRNTSLWVSVGM